MKNPSYSSVRADLRCAQAEAKGYLAELLALRREAATLKADLDRWESIARGSDRLVSVLIRALEDAQKSLIP